MSIERREREVSIGVGGRADAIQNSDTASTSGTAGFGIPGVGSSVDSVAIKILTRAHSITAVLEIPAAGAEGVIVSHGNSGGGYTLFIQDERLHYVHNYCGALELYVVSLDPVPTGHVRVRAEFEPTRSIGRIPGEGFPGRTQLFFEERMVADKIFPVTVPLSVGGVSGLSVGKNPGTAVSRLYEAPFAFTGKIVSVRYDLSDRVMLDAADIRPTARVSRQIEH